MGIPVTQEEEDAMREEMKPKWYDFAFPGYGRGLKMVGGMAANAARQLYQGGKEAYQEGQNVKTTADVIPALTRTYVSGQEHLLKAVPGGEQLWNFGQDVHEGNWAGAAGGATSAFLQAALGDALFGERPSGPKATATATRSVPPSSMGEVIPTPRPAAAELRQPSGRYETEGAAPSKSSETPGASAASTEKNSTFGAPTRPLTHRADVKEFFQRNPELKGQVVVHHAIEKRAATIYPNVITKEMIHTGDNLRGIPKKINPELHLSQIRKELNAFYKQNPQATEAQVRAKVAEIDAKYGSRFLPPKKR
jgi:hypothetical protein